MLRKELSTVNDQLKASFLCTFFWGLLAHGFAFANLNLSHDSLNEFYLFDSTPIKFRLGRFSEPILRVITGEFVTMPWLTGFITLLLISGAVCFTVRIFELSSLGEIALLSGIFTTNITVTALVGTYSHDLSGNMFALFLSVWTVYLWKQTCEQFSPGLFSLAVIATAFSLGFYQSFLSVSIVLIMIYSILQLLKGSSAANVFKKGVYGIVILAAGFILYFALVPLSNRLSGVPLESGAYNNLSSLSTINQSLLKKIIFSYLNVLWAFFGLSYETFTIAALSEGAAPLSPENAWMYLRLVIHAALGCVTVFILLKGMLKKKRGLPENLLLLTLVLCLPPAMDIAYIGSGMTHILMQYSYWLIYLFAGLLINWARSEDGIFQSRWTASSTAAAAVMVLLLLFNNVQTSNTLYVKKELESRATLSTMTRILDKLEGMDDYVYGETPVAFICSAGISAQDGIPGTEHVSTIIGAWCHSDIVFVHHFQKYFNNVLQYNIHACDREEVAKLKDREEILSMPEFPNRGSIQTIDGIIVVKLGIP